MKILDRLPYSAEPTTLTVRGEQLRVRPYQIIVWVSINIQDALEWDPRLPAVPAVWDSGNNHNFSIGRSQLVRWAGIQPEALERRGSIRERGRHTPLHAATLWLHANQSGRRELRTDQGPYQLYLREGIAVYADEAAPRLPVLGLRALTVNKLHQVLDSERQRVTLRSPDWRTNLLRWLS